MPWTLQALNGPPGTRTAHNILSGGSHSRPRFVIELCKIGKMEVFALCKVGQNPFTFCCSILIKLVYSLIQASVIGNEDL